MQKMQVLETRPDGSPKKVQYEGQEQQASLFFDQMLEAGLSMDEAHDLSIKRYSDCQELLAWRADR